MGAKIYEYPVERLEQQLEAGTAAPYSAEHLPSYGDCSDIGELNQSELEMRTTPLAVRYFGGPIGMAETVLNTVIMQEERGNAYVKEWLNQHEHGVAELATQISEGAHRIFGMTLSTHSSVEHERSHTFDVHTNQDKPHLDCTLTQNIAKIANLAEHREARGIIHEIAKVGDLDASPRHIDYGLKSYGRLARLLEQKESDTTVNRNALRDVIGNKDDVRFLPVALLRRQRTKPADSTLVVDIAGYQMTADSKTIVDSLPIAELILPQILPEFRLDETALRISALGLSGGTRQAMGMKNIAVIPPSSAILQPAA